jgi:hypothetical protein
MQLQYPDFCGKDTLQICQNLLGHFVPSLTCLSLGSINWMGSIRVFHHEHLGALTPPPPNPPPSRGRAYFSALAGEVLFANFGLPLLKNAMHIIKSIAYTKQYPGLSFFLNATLDARSRTARRKT